MPGFRSSPGTRSGSSGSAMARQCFASSSRPEPAIQPSAARPEVPGGSPDELGPPPRTADDRGDPRRRRVRARRTQAADRPGRCPRRTVSHHALVGELAGTSSRSPADLRSGRGRWLLPTRGPRRQYHRGDPHRGSRAGRPPGPIEPAGAPRSHGGRIMAKRGDVPRPGWRAAGAELGWRQAPTRAAGARSAFPAGRPGQTARRCERSARTPASGSDRTPTAADPHAGSRWPALPTALPTVRPIADRTAARLEEAGPLGSLTARYQTLLAMCTSCDAAPGGPRPFFSWTTRRKETAGHPYIYFHSKTASAFVMQLTASSWSPPEGARARLPMRLEAGARQRRTPPPASGPTAVPSAAGMQDAAPWAPLERTLASYRWPAAIAHP
jgi:hypothetical protein